MNIVVFLLLFVSVAFAGSAQFSPQYNVSWSVDESTKIITFHLNVVKIAWVGIGFHPVGFDTSEGEMVNADVIIATFDNGKATVGDYFSSGFIQPDLDTTLGGSNNILSFTGKQVAGVTSVSFTRRLVTGDAYDTPLTIGPMNVIWAVGIDNSFDYHGSDSSNRGYQILDFFDSDVCGPSKGCQACVEHSQCIYCSDDTLCYLKGNTGQCFTLNTTCAEDCPNQLANSWVPDGFCASVWADGLRNPRGMVTASNNDLLVVESSRNVVTVLWELNGAVSRADLAFATGINHGIAINGEYLYASSSTTLYRWKYQAGMRTNLGAPQTVVINIPCCHHTTRTLIFDQNGQVYISSGSGSNVDPDSSHAQIRRFNVSAVPVGGINWNNGFLFADGLRNEVGIGFDNLGRLWGVENGCDNLNRADLGGDIHINNPSEEVNLFETEGKFYGYPYCWSEYLLPQFGKGVGTQWVHPNFMNDGVHSDDWCRNTSNVVPPSYNMAAHQAPLDIKFYYGTSFPASYVGGAFVSLHGSWNRNPPQGYRVLYLTFQNGLPTGESPFLRHDGPSENWPNNVRPVGLTYKQCGNNDCLYVSSDSTGQIIQISYLGGGK